MQGEPTLLKMSRLRMKETLQALNRVTGITVDEFIQNSQEDVAMYNSLRHSAEDHLTYAFIEKETYEQFLKDCLEM